MEVKNSNPNSPSKKIDIEEVYKYSPA